MEVYGAVVKACDFLQQSRDPILIRVHNSLTVHCKIGSANLNSCQSLSSFVLRSRDLTKVCAVQKSSWYIAKFGFLGIDVGIS